MKELKQHGEALKRSKGGSKVLNDETEIQDINNQVMQIFRDNNKIEIR